MDFRIADTFTDSLARLTGEEQKLVKTTAFDLQLNPTGPGMSSHKLDQAKDKNFWSVRVGYGVPAEWLADVRQAGEDSLLLLADHLPGEAAEAMLELVNGGQPLMPQPVAKDDLGAC